MNLTHESVPISAKGKGGRFLKSCIICESHKLHYLFSASGMRIVRCEDCGLRFLNPQPSNEDLERLVHSVPETPKPGADLMANLLQYCGNDAPDILQVCDENDPGLECENQYDACILQETLAISLAPLDFLRKVRFALKPHGVIVIVNSNSNTTNRIKQPQGDLLRVTYFDSKTLQSILFKAGFRHMIPPESFPDKGATSMQVFARKLNLPKVPTLSVIVPAFNEAETFEELMTAVLAKELEGIAIEIVVVESNSSDGTREIALKYRDHERVKLILEDRPRGKGFAVRTGLKAATGDYILIQDSDLEYDIEDYDALLEPIVAGRTAFVLGSRHGGRDVWKMRQFTGQKSLSFVLNLGHWVFTTLVNVLFSQRLRDPFTMYKVFRRDCLYGLEFECNRFDFDYELLIKLIRKGYIPVEIPVNYRSRSFKEGKKVRMVSDPISWLKALIWLKFLKFDVLKNSYKERLLNAQNDCQQDDLLR